MVGDEMKRAFQKNILRTIRRSLGRYMAIFAIIALGVGFFTGLKASKPDMMKTGQDYIKNQSLYDFRLISTWGFTAEEVEEIAQLDTVKTAQGAMWEDFLYEKEDGTDECLKAMSVTDSVNLLTLTAGQLPQRPEECVLDANCFSEDMIGKELVLSQGNSQETKDSFAYDRYRVTGLVRSPLYLNRERGTTTIGNGRLNGFVFLMPEGFSYEYLKEVYVVTTEEGEAFSDQYEDQMEELKDDLTERIEAVLHQRYQKEIQDGERKLKDAEAELAEETTKAEAELADAKQELQDGEEALAKARQELADGEAELASQEQKLSDAENELNRGEVQYQQGLAEYQSGWAQYEAGALQLEENRGSYQQAKAAKEQMEAAAGAEWGEGASGILNQDETYRTLSEAVVSFESNQAVLQETQNRLAQAKAQLDHSQAQLSGARAELRRGKEQLQEAKETLENGRQEIAENEQKLADGWKEYEEGKAELEQEVADAEQEISDARQELADVEAPELFVLDRNTNPGYAGYESDVSIVEGVARVFPIFFFLIAALVCSTTMTRMVDDERTQIGTLRALGYSNGAIFFKYMLYSGSAAGLGAAAGYFLGTRIFPTTIWIAYGMLYGFADIVIVDNLWLFLLSLAVSLLCSAGTTFAACRLELLHTPAELIRPKAPAAGKRILLEKLTFFWKRLKFLHKVSARNVFRFKKRMIMMILGIAGCTSLVIAGFGVKDSVSNIVNNQYEQIFQYQISAVFQDSVSESIQSEVQAQYQEEIRSSSVLMETSAEVSYDQGSKTISLMVAEGAEIENCVDFHYKDRHVALPQKGEILIDTRLAQVLQVKKGDTITLKSGEKEAGPFVVSGIFENYTFYYAYMTSETYEAYFGEVYEPKSMYLSLSGGADDYEIASYLSNREDSSNVTVVEDLRIRVGNMMESMNFVVALIIGCAAALAFIVLFNLGNINISERVREIATLKVLGFYPRETGAYVFRESMVLSVMGIVCGIPLGILLHRFIMLQLKVDMVTFEIRIRWNSYVYSVFAVLLFTICVDLLMRRKINRIDMAESLKSIE